MVTPLGDTARVLLWHGSELVTGTVGGEVVHLASPVAPTVGTPGTPGVPAAHDVGSSISAMAPLGPKLAAGTDEGEIWICPERGDPQLLLTLPDPIAAISTSPSGAVAAAGETLVELTPMRPISFIQSPTGQITALATTTAVGSVLAAGGVAGLALVDLGPRGDHCWVEVPTITALAVSPDGQLVAAGDLSGSLHIIDPLTGEGEEITGYPDRIGEMCWMGDSRAVAVAADDEVTLWSVDPTGHPGDEPRLLPGPHGRVTAVCASHSLLATGDRSGRITIWDNPDQDNQPVLTHETGSPVVTLAWSPQGDALAASTTSGELVTLTPPGAGRRALGAGSHE